VISSYKYHIVIENGSFEDYWTEKLADAFLGKAYPFYHGCPNLLDYFPKNSFTAIDINNFDESVAVIRKSMDQHYYERSIDAIETSRNLVLDKYNLFPMLAKLCSGMQSTSRKNDLTLQPEESFGKEHTIQSKSLISKIKNIFVG
jgi:hypothetical protein